MLCIDVDLFPLKEAEKERRRLREQLQQSQKMEAIGVLAGGIAHDFNNFLTVIIGNAELTVDRSPVDSSMRDEVGQIIQAGLCAKDQVGQIFDFQDEKRSIRFQFCPVWLSKKPSNSYVQNCHLKL